MRKKLLIGAIFLLVNSMFAYTIAAQSTNDLSFEKARKKLVKILRSDKNGVKIKLKNGQTIKGRLTAVDVDFFTLVENKSKTTKDINFSDVKKVKRHSKFFSRDNMLVGGTIGFLILYGIRGAN